MATLLCIFLWFTACAQDLPEIRGYDFENKKIDDIKLSKELSEASGLAFAANGNLLCHNDEKATVYELDYRTGKVLKNYSLGKFQVHRGDFEGIATKRDTIFMVNSSGTILRALPGKDGEIVPFQTFKTPLSARNDVEGLAYDPTTNCLLLACKGEAGIDLKNALPKDQKAVYAFSLKTYKLLPKPRFLISVSRVTAKTGDKEFSPSAIERHPRTGNFFILASRGNAIVELDTRGNLVGVSSLPKSVHSQPEGLAFAPDGTALICNEGQGKAGRLVIYSPR